MSRRIATAARAPIVVGDVFQDEAAGEVQLRYMASMDGAPLDKAARTHEKLRTLSELLAPFTSPEREEGITPLTIEVGFLRFVGGAVVGLVVLVVFVRDCGGGVFVVLVFFFGGGGRG